MSILLLIIALFNLVPTAHAGSCHEVCKAHEPCYTLYSGRNYTSGDWYLCDGPWLPRGKTIRYYGSPPPPLRSRPVQGQRRATTYAEPRAQPAARHAPTPTYETDTAYAPVAIPAREVQIGQSKAATLARKAWEDDRAYEQQSAETERDSALTEVDDLGAEIEKLEARIARITKQLKTSQKGNAALKAELEDDRALLAAMAERLEEQEED